MAEEGPSPSSEQELSELPEEIDRTQEGGEEEDDDADTEDLPPLRMHATKGHVQRLSASKIIMPEDLQKSLTSEDRRSARRRLGKGDGLPRSRSRSPSMKNTETTVDGGSSISSLDDVADYMGIDVLLDKAGFEELDPLTSSISVKELTASFRALQPVTERLTNDDLEDVHAFSDLQPPARGGMVSSGDNSIATGGEASNFMETLDECDNEENDEEDIPNRPAVVLENLENLELDEKEMGGEGAGEGTAPRGDESGRTE